jgi:hypothetical protein
MLSHGRPCSSHLLVSLTSHRVELVPGPARHVRASACAHAWPSQAMSRSRHHMTPLSGLPLGALRLATQMLVYTSPLLCVMTKLKYLLPALQNVRILSATPRSVTSLTSVAVYCVLVANSQLLLTNIFTASAAQFNNVAALCHKAASTGSAQSWPLPVAQRFSEKALCGVGASGYAECGGLQGPNRDGIP